MAVVQRGEKYGTIDRAGKIVLRLRWDEAQPFDSKDMAIVKLDGKYGCIDRAGEIIVPLAWDFIFDFGDDDKARVTRENRVGFINRKGDIVVPAAWDSLSPLLIDHAPWLRRRFLDGSQSAIDPLTPDVLVAQRNKTSGVIDWSGKVIIAPEWESVSIRTDAGSEQCCFVVSRNVKDDAQLGWMKTTRDGFYRLIGRAEQRNVLCHLYATDGRLLWSSDWLSSAFWSVVLAVLAGVVVIGDGVVLLRRRRRAKLAILSEPRTQ